MPVVKISLSDLQKLSTNVLLKNGAEPKEAEEAVRHYLYNEACGKSSHGMVRVAEAARALKKYRSSYAPLELEHETDSIMNFNAHGQIGSSAVKHTLDIALNKVKETDIVFLGVHNYIASTGSMTYYLRSIAEQKMIAIMGCNSIALVSPPNGKERRIGTNPLGICIPSSNDKELIADLATSAIAYGKIMVAGEKGESLPEGCLIDENGIPTTEAGNAIGGKFSGSIIPLAGHKGFALGLMIELLSGPLIGAKAVKDKLYDNDGFFCILMNPKKFSNPNVLEHLSEALQDILDTPSQTNADQIILPGMQSLEKYRHALKSEHIDIADKTYQSLIELNQER